MCLKRSSRATKELLDDYSDEEEIVVWKVYEEVFCSSHIEIRPPYGYVFGDESIQPGWVQSDRDSKEKDSMDVRRWWGITQIHFRGIHAFLTQEAAKKLKESLFFYGIYKVFKCTAKIDNLVAVSGNKKEAVFMKIHISEQEFEYGVKGVN